MEVKHAPAATPNLLHREASKMRMRSGPLGHGPDVWSGGAKIQATHIVVGAAPVKSLRRLVGQMYVPWQVGHQLMISRRRQPWQRGPDMRPSNRRRDNLPGRLRYPHPRTLVNGPRRQEVALF